MSGLTYLTYEQVVDINARHCGDGAGVRDEEGVRAALGRAEATFAGQDLYPSVLEKAAALVHGLSTTQYFLDGNKRTAWIVADLFLATNGHALRDIADIEGEAFVLSIATRAFENADDPGRAIRKAADWFSEARLTGRDRLEFALLGIAFRGDGSVFDASRAGSEVFEIPGVPIEMRVGLALSVIPHHTDAGEPHTIEVSIHAGGSAFSAPVRLQGGTVTKTVPSDYFLNYLPGTNQPYPVRLFLPLDLRVDEHAGGIVRVLFDGQVMAERPISFIPPFESPNDASSLL